MSLKVESIVSMVVEASRCIRIERASKKMFPKVVEGVVSGRSSCEDLMLGGAD